MEYSLDSFIDRLLVENGIEGLSDEVMEQLKSDLKERAEDMINAEILANMPESALSEFENKLDKGTDEEVQAFCRTHIENFDEVVAGGLIKLKKAYLTNIAG
jgi:hypothetical protein